MDIQALSIDTKATLLLIAHMGQPSDDAVELLKPSEYRSLVNLLSDLDLRPGDLFDESNLERLKCAGACNVQQMTNLLQRGLTLAMAYEKWSSQGIWVLGYSDLDYPAHYKEKLKTHAPPVLFGIGDKALLSAGGVSITGSRSADQQGIEFARASAKSSAAHGVQVISGGARGVDGEAMRACIDDGGSVVGVLADSLARRAVSGECSAAIVNGSLVLISPFEPETGFFIYNAMARNKLIYTLADFALVVSAEDGKGGTWSGAKENLDKRWTPLFVRKDDTAPAGNMRLIECGGRAITKIPSDIVDWMRQQITMQAVSKDDLPSQGSLPLF